MTTLHLSTIQFGGPDAPEHAVSSCLQIDGAPFRSVPSNLLASGSAFSLQDFGALSRVEPFVLLKINRSDGTFIIPKPRNCGRFMTYDIVGTKTLSQVTFSKESANADTVISRVRYTDGYEIDGSTSVDTTTNPLGTDEALSISVVGTFVVLDFLKPDGTLRQIVQSDSGLFVQDESVSPRP